jgi:hypothetical protein
LGGLFGTVVINCLIHIGFGGMEVMVNQPVVVGKNKAMTN